MTDLPAFAEADPICFTCNTPVPKTEMLFAPICPPGGCQFHDPQCPSMVWHPACLMEYLDHQARTMGTAYAVVAALRDHLHGEGQ